MEYCGNRKHTFYNSITGVGNLLQHKIVKPFLRYVFQHVAQLMQIRKFVFYALSLILQSI